MPVNYRDSFTGGRVWQPRMYPQLYHPSNIVGKAEINLSVILGAHGTPGVAGASAGNIVGGLALWDKL